MKILLIIIIGFLVLIYTYTYIKHKKRKKNQVSTVENYRKNYIERISASEKKVLDDDVFQKQVTKYNSSIDYIEWNEFVSEINDEKKDLTQKAIKPKKLQY